MVILKDEKERKDEGQNALTSIKLRHNINNGIHRRTNHGIFVCVSHVKWSTSVTCDATKMPRYLR